jgi:predicted deacylase
MTMWVLAAPVAGLWYLARRLGQPIEPGDVLGKIRDMFGAVQETGRSDRAGFIPYQLSSLVERRRGASGSWDSDGLKGQLRRRFSPTTVGD